MQKALKLYDEVDKLRWIALETAFIPLQDDSINNHLIISLQPGRIGLNRIKAGPG